jgi:hypothetical protein
MLKKIMLTTVIMASTVQHAASRDEKKPERQTVATVIGAAPSESKCHIGTSLEDDCVSLLMPSLMQDKFGNIYIVPPDYFKQKHKRWASF